MASGYRGVFLIGNKAANRITDVQVVDAGGNTIPLPFAEYVARGAEPNYKTLPWQEDVEAKQAEPKPQVPSLSHVVTYRGAATDNWSAEETDDTLHADQRNSQRSRGSRAGQRVEEDMLFAGNSLAKAQRLFECFIKRRPKSRLTIRQRTRVLQECPPSS